jgi:DNA polymerase
MTSHPPSLAREIDAALAFWNAAGVDCDFGDDARAWLLDPAEATVPPASDVQPPAGGNTPSGNQPANRSARDKTAPPAPRRHDFWGDSPPPTLAAFREWWMNAPDLGAGSYPRVPPRGTPGAALMVVVPDPESADRDLLLSGPQGRLLARILAAMGLGADDYYLASALPRHTPMADLAGLAASGMDQVLAHHVALAAPARVILFGQGLESWLAPSQTARAHPLRENNQIGSSPAVMITETLGSMLDMPQLKSRFWRRWMEWSA